MPIARITSLGGDLYHVHVIDASHPDQGLPGQRPGGRPDQGLPGGQFPGRPVDPGFGHGGVIGGHPDQGLPGQGRPGGGGGIPDHELPDTPPPQIAPGWTLVLVRHQGKWSYAAISPGIPVQPLPPTGGGGQPDQGLPGRPGMGGGHPDQGLPGQGGRPDNSLPGQRPGMPPRPDNSLPGGPNRPDQGLPPTAQPKR